MSDENGSDQGPKPAQNNEAEGQFTVDAATSTDLAQMPSLTRLLNRKKLEIPRTNKPSSPPPTEPPAALEEAACLPAPETMIVLTASDKAPGAIVLETPPPQILQISTQDAIPTPEAASEASLVSHEDETYVALSVSAEAPQTPSTDPDEEPTCVTSNSGLRAPIVDLAALRSSAQKQEPQPQQSAPAPAIKPATIKRVAPTAKKTEVAPLITWDLNQLKTSSDPLAKALTFLFLKGVVSSLFLRTLPPSHPQETPKFNATAIAGERSRVNLWTGLQWDPAIAPEVWQQFSKVGYLELGPSGTGTQLKSQRNVLRSALGLKSDEWLIIVRVGSDHASRGIVALFSNRSVAAEFRSALPLFLAKIDSRAAA